MNIKLLLRDRLKLMNQKLNMSMKNKNKPKLLGGFGEINFGKQYRQGNRVYDSDHIAMCLCASPIGNMGGYSYLYLIRTKNNE